MTAPLMRDRETDHRANRLAAWGGCLAVVFGFLILGFVIGGILALAFHHLTK